MSGIILDPAQGKYICSVIAIVFFYYIILLINIFFTYSLFMFIAPHLPF